jgi:hypothetical protein
VHEDSPREKTKRLLSLAKFLSTQKDDNKKEAINTLREPWRS